ncbi:hypothetical protein RRG08_031241 [Elysia crispata]|uniref:Uncharacterized protein n=1 Tax=Elysia crispata TaxID=231223 RepID=A0AAE1AIP4_9GAST|nr:hypothetical protein RRG08_031241 [Elysia crispata]
MFTHEVLERVNHLLIVQRYNSIKPIATPAISVSDVLSSHACMDVVLIIAKQSCCLPLHAIWSQIYSPLEGSFWDLESRRELRKNRVPTRRPEDLVTSPDL